MERGSCKSGTRTCINWHPFTHCIDCSDEQTNTMDAVTSHAWVSDLGGFPPARVARGSSSSFASRVAYFLLSFSFLHLIILFYIDTKYDISS